MKIAYESWRPGPDMALMVERADQICREYARAGDSLTLRQLYYQFVRRNWLPNKERSYKNLGAAITRGRMAGLIDWNHLTDRTRNATAYRPGDPWAPGDIVRAAPRSYTKDQWEGQDLRIEVWVEKEALGEVVGRAASALRCGSLACKGYMSASEMWEAGRRFGSYIAGGQKVLLLHLGDHDPSGIDMTRDIRDRLSTFIGGDHIEEHHGLALADWGEGLESTELGPDALAQMAYDLSIGDASTAEDVFEVKRIALNMDQIREYDPPPNPTKMTDSRGTGYYETYGEFSWELDALPPQVLRDLITNEILQHRDQYKLDVILAEQATMRERMTEAIEPLAVRFDEGDF